MDEFDEFEMQYADELELMDEDMGPRNEVIQTPTPALAKSLVMTPAHPQTLPSPQLSQISGGSYLGRRLFDGQDAKRFASTPFPTAQRRPLGQGQGEDGNALAEIQNIGLRNTRKRRLDDIFGDIHDIEEEEQECGINKKVKNEEERDMELIQAILNARKQSNSNALIPRSSNIDRLEAMHTFKMQNLSYIVPKWPFIKVIRSDNERIYVRCHSEEFETMQINEIHGKRDELGLLGRNKQQTWNEASEINLKRLIDRPPEDAPVEIVSEDSLWVERYKPRKYIELLSDESCNRNLLKWIKLWDKVVFNRDVKKVEKKEYNSQNQQQQQQQKLNTFNKRTGRFEQTGGWIKRSQKSNLNTELDELNRPIQKIALISGPPGLGKTTLAHVIARHAGYEPLEINASDDRTPEAFRLALENGTQMQNVFAGHKRPNCIILDEIDGAPTASIDFLLRFIAGNVKEKGKKGGGGGNDGKFILRRPIICICNELYVASLRQLRQHAFVITVPPTESAKLAERLMMIAQKQHVKTDLSTLFALAEKTGNDIRSCLSLLQFFSNKKHELKMIDVLRSNIGQKDQHKELFKIWNTIFQIQRPTRAITESEEKNYGPMTTLPPPLRMKVVLETVRMGNDYEKLAQGVFDNYLTQKMPDPNFNGIIEATDWFTFNDRLNSHIQATQNYSTYAYLPFSFLCWHFLFATLAYPKIILPTKSYEVYQKSLVTKNILTSLRKSIECGKKGIGDTLTVLYLDAIPFIKRILSPTMRSVSLQLLTPRERTDVRYTVEIMADLGLSYVQLKAPDGTYQYQIEPDIEYLGKFDEGFTNGLSYWCKQLIAREVEIEKMRRKQVKLNPEGAFDEGKYQKNQKKTKKDEALPNFLQTLQPKQIQEKPREKVDEVVRKDFFGRVTAKPSTTTGNKAFDKTDNIVKSPIWYCYKEGFNNAVRKSVTIADLI